MSVKGKVKNSETKTIIGIIQVTNYTTNDVTTGQTVWLPFGF